jgi:hypothetical protein
MEQFLEHCVGSETRSLSEQVKKLITAMRHRPRQPQTQLHQQFLRQQYELAQSLQRQYPQLDLRRALAYFKEATDTIA